MAESIKVAVVTPFSMFSPAWLSNIIDIVPKFSFRTGGTYLRLFPSIITINNLRKTFQNGHIPLLYMHPYEFLKDYEFWIPWKDFINLSLPKKIIKWSRQIQWHKVGNAGVYSKLSKITNLFEHQGPMNTLLKN